MGLRPYNEADHAEDDKDGMDRRYPPMTGHDEHQHPKLDALVERSEAKLLSRYAVPVLVFLLLAVTTYTSNELLRRSDARDANDTKQNEDIAAIKTKVEVLNTKLDAGVIRQIETNRTTIEDHENRLQRVERAVRILD